MEKTKIEILDEVLRFLNSTTTWHDLRQRFPDSMINKEIMRTILRKLIRDNYVDRFSGLTLIPKDEEVGYVNETKIQRNFEGDLFVEAGGYAQQKINSDEENTRLKKVENSQLKQGKTLNNLTLGIVIASVVAAIYYVIQIIGYFNSHCYFR